MGFYLSARHESFRQTQKLLQGEPTANLRSYRSSGAVAARMADQKLAKDRKRRLGSKRPLQGLRFPDPVGGVFLSGASLPTSVPSPMRLLSS